MKTSRTAAILLGAVALGSIGFVGCGSSDSPATTAAAPAESGDAGQRLTAEEYVSAADKVCSEGTAELQALTPPSDPAETKAYITEVATIAASVSEGLIGLVPPEELEPAAKKLVEASLQGTEWINNVAAETPDAATSEEATAAKEKVAAGASEAFVADEKAAAAELGLTECGKDDSDSESDSAE